jgi:hypothetical protein
MQAFRKVPPNREGVSARTIDAVFVLYKLGAGVLRLRGFARVNVS